MCTAAHLSIYLIGEALTFRHDPQRELASHGETYFFFLLPLRVLFPLLLLGAVTLCSCGFFFLRGLTTGVAGGQGENPLDGAGGSWQIVAHTIMSQGALQHYESFRAYVD